MYERILVGTDGSAEAQKAADHAAKLAVLAGGTVVVASVAVEHGMPASPWSDEPRDHPIPLGPARARAERESVRLAEVLGVAAETVVLEGHAAPALAAEAAGGAYSLLVVGERGVSAGGPPRMGSVAEELARVTPVPLLIVP